jgi:hypothetical protein
VIGPVAFLDTKSSWVDLYPLRSVTFKDHHVQPRGANPFGQVDGGWIRLAAPLAPMAMLNRGGANGLGSGDDSIQFDFEDAAGDLWLLFLMYDERDSDAVERRDIMDLVGIVVSRVQDLEARGGEGGGFSKGCWAYEKVGFFMLERSKREGDSLLKRLDRLVTEVVLV